MQRFDTFGSNPIPGDPYAVSSAATNYREVAEAISDAARRLGKLDAGKSHSDAVTEFIKKADDLGTKLTKAHGRYAAAGSALSAYAGSLQNAQDVARPAAHNHDDAVYAYERAQKLHDQHQQDADAATDPTSKAASQKLADSQKQTVAQLLADITRYGSQVTAARTDRDTAAQTAIQLIDAGTRDGLHDNWFDDFHGWMKANDGWISTVMQVLAVVGTILAIASLFFPLTAWIGILALVIMAASVVGSGLRAAAGTGSWSDFALNVFSLLTFGAGRILVTAAKGVTTTMQATRVAGLVDGGASEASALSRVTQSVARVTPDAARLPFRFAAAGDGDAASLMQWVTTSRVGAFADDPGVVNSVTNLLHANSVLGWSSQVNGVAGIIDLPTHFMEPLQSATTAKLNWGTSW